MPDDHGKVRRDAMLLRHGRSNWILAETVGPKTAPSLARTVTHVAVRAMRWIDATSHAFETEEPDGIDRILGWTVSGIGLAHASAPCLRTLSLLACQNTPSPMSFLSMPHLRTFCSHDVDEESPGGPGPTSIGLNLE